MPKKPKQFLVGHIVRHTGEFLRSIGMYAGAPINGRVESVVLDGYFKGWPYVLWSDADEPKLVNPANIELDPRTRQINEKVSASASGGREGSSMGNVGFGSFGGGLGAGPGHEWQTADPRTRKPFIWSEAPLVTLPDGRVFPLYKDEILSWDIGVYMTANEQRRRYPRARVVIQAMRAERPLQLVRERRALTKAAFDRMFGHNAQQELDLINEELHRG